MGEKENRSSGEGLFTVQCDFDDTITVSNVGEALLDEFVPEQWRDFDAEYLAGQFTVEESNRRKFALIKASEKAIHEFVSRTVEFRPGFLQFVEYCRKEHIGFVIVSCGLDQYIDPSLRKMDLLDLERYSGRGLVTGDGIAVDYVDPRRVRRNEGFKVACLEYLKQRGRPVIYIGDGRSDVAPAIKADHVIARDELLEHFDSRSIPHFKFDTFYDVLQVVKGLLVGR